MRARKGRHRKKQLERERERESKIEVWLLNSMFVPIFLCLK